MLYKFMEEIYIIDADPLSRESLKGFLGQEGVFNGCKVVSRPESGEIPCIFLAELGEKIENQGNITLKMQKPVRIGAILDEIAKIRAKSGQINEIIAIGPYQLNSINHELKNLTAGEVIRLTEKEGKILAILGQNPGQVMERKDLLQAVWGYADGIENHTLETHIYRLRRKIEADPANPQILITQEPGYKIKN
jgi:DNA-binding response OmpR family regulator